MKIRSVRSRRRRSSMSTWMCAPRARAARRIGRSRALTAAAEPSGSAAPGPGARAPTVTPLEVLAQVADEIAVAVEGGEHVDETEELELGLLVSERPREERGGPAVGRIERLAVGGDAIKDLAADFLHARLAGPDAHDHLSLTPYPCHTHQTKSATMTSASAKCATTPVSTPRAAPTPVRTLGPGARPARSSPAIAPMSGPSSRPIGATITATAGRASRRRRRRGCRRLGGLPPRPPHAREPTPARRARRGSRARRRPWA